MFERLSRQASAFVRDVRGVPYCSDRARAIVLMPAAPHIPHRARDYTGDKEEISASYREISG